MEIRFRPLPPSTLARKASPGQTPTEDGQSFVEVVESLTAADQTPEKDANAGNNRERRPQNRSLGVDHEPIEDAMQAPVEEIPESEADNPGLQPAGKPDPQSKSVGTRLDLTA